MQPIRRHTILLGIVWVAFVLRGLFYCVQQPMWEGYDEWAHFALIQHIGEFKQIPSRSDPVSSQVEDSLLLVPLSPSAARMPGTMTHDSFWRLSVDERRRREERLRNLPSGSQAGTNRIGTRQYEAQQPPLYYVVLAAIHPLLKHWSMPAQVLAFRCLNVVIASIVVLLGYGIALQVLRNSKLALFSAVLVAALPGLYIDVCRISNESLAIVLVSTVVLYGIRVCRSEGTSREWLLLGAFMGGALLTKAYAVALVPLLPVVALVRVIRYPRPWKSTVLGCACAFVTVAVIAGWWYWRVWEATGTISGEQIDVAASAFTFTQKLSASRRMDWRAAADVGAFTHIWTGGWSFLLVRRWMYRVVEFVALLAAIGLLMGVLRSWRKSGISGTPAAGGETVIIATAYALMVLALAYQAVVIFLTHNVTLGLGWYLYAVVVPEVVLLIVGLRALFGGRWSTCAVASVCVLAIALDLYTVHFMLMPYYTGMISHRASGALESFKIGSLVGGIAVLFQRMATNKPAFIGALSIMIMWVAYMASTLTLAIIAVLTAAVRQPVAVHDQRERRRAPAT